MIFLKTVLLATAIAAFVAGASFAQGGNPIPGERTDANGMPPTLSTPSEKAQTIDGIVMTNLDQADLRHMADERV